MKTKRFWLILPLLVALFGAQCKKDVEEASCGCDSESVREVDSMEGILRYVEQDSPNDFYKNVYRVGPEGVKDGQHIVYIVCDETMFTSEMKNLKNNPENTLKVKFSGELKSLCNLQFNPSNIHRDHIKLTKIELL